MKGHKAEFDFLEIARHLAIRKHNFGYLGDYFQLSLRYAVCINNILKFV